jgi:hypothetical protein
VSTFPREKGFRAAAADNTAKNGLSKGCVRIVGAADEGTAAIAAQSKTDSLVLAFRGLDRQQELAILHPVIAPDIGVQLQAGPRKLERGAVLNCKASARTRSAIVESEIGQFSEMGLECGDHKFVVTAIDFDPRAK